jgi:hypothetical protein
MIKIESPQVWGFKHAIRGMRNPKNSWGNSDSKECVKLADNKCKTCPFFICENNTPQCNISKTPMVEKFVLGENDIALCNRLVKAGTDHRKFLRQIMVSFDLTAPLYFLKEWDTYKVATVANSTSTMHKIMDKELCVEDFSYDHLTKDDDMFCGVAGIDILLTLIENLNEFREAYLKTNDKKYWYNLIQLLPSSYNQKRTITLNYEVLANIYKSRKNHKLKEWRDFCKFIETLPYFKEIVLAD